MLRTPDIQNIQKRGRVYISICRGACTPTYTENSKRGPGVLRGEGDKKTGPL